MRYKIIFSYDGNEFYGYAKQPGLRTIQGVIENNLSLVLNEEVNIFASGRTDKGVHAIGQVAHFDTTKDFDCDKIKSSLNKMFNEEIVIRELYAVEETFNARFSAKEKVYLYVISLGELNIFKRNYCHYEKALDVEKMIEASKLFIGKHSFLNFCSKEEDEFNFIRTINSIDFIIKDNYLKIRFNGDGFMRYEIRKIVGTLIAYSKSKITLEEIRNLIVKKERDIVTFTAPGKGLFLENVIY